MSAVCGWSFVLVFGCMVMVSSPVVIAHLGQLGYSFDLPCVHPSLAASRGAAGTPAGSTRDGFFAPPAVLWFAGGSKASAL